MALTTVQPVAWWQRLRDRHSERPVTMDERRRTDEYWIHEHAMLVAQLEACPGRVCVDRERYELVDADDNRWVVRELPADVRLGPPRQLRLFWGESSRRA